MFLNYSNHPSIHWDKKQIEATGAYGVIVDIPFPTVLPNSNEDEIEEMADKAVRDIQLKAQPAENTAVMVQGEFTLTYALINRLRELGYKVVSACSERNVVETVDDKGNKIKESKFVFTRFREYR